MKKYIVTLAFYAISFIVIYAMNNLSPGQQDGGPGLASLAIILVVIAALILAGVNVYKGIKGNKEYFILAAIHFIISVAIINSLFL